MKDVEKRDHPVCWRPLPSASKNRVISCEGFFRSPQVLPLPSALEALLKIRFR
jgi:hypothetical protein